MRRSLARRSAEDPRRVRVLLTTLVLTAAAFAVSVPANSPDAAPGARRNAAGRPGVLSPGPQSASDLKPTLHPSLPADLDHYWLVPPAGWKAPVAEAAARDLSKAVSLLDANKPAQALVLIRPAELESTPLGGYARYLTALAQLGLERFDAARQTLTALRASRPSGFLYEAASLRLADLAESQRDWAGAAAICEDLLAQKPASPVDVMMRLARTSSAAGNRKRAVEIYLTLYYEWPASEGGDAARRDLNPIEFDRIGPDTPRLLREIDRAERLFAARRYEAARDAYELVAAHATGDQVELAAVRRAECEYYLRRFQRARDGLRSWTDTGSRQAEALFFVAVTARALNQTAEFTRLARRIAEEFPTTTWAEDALDSLATQHIVDDEDDEADRIVRDSLTRFPSGRHAQRAYWRVGWRAYRQGRFTEAADTLERAAVTFPRSDYRPSYLYWAGQARERLSERAAADERFQLAFTDYGNTYYGRLAARQLAAHGRSVAPAGEAARRWVSPAAGADEWPASADVVRWLIGIEMYDEAVDEVQWAERAYGSTPQLRATRAWLANRRGELRPAITMMRQAFPHILASGGETLPREIQAVVFPLAYWPLIRQYSTANGLDPYLVAAVICQESTFDADAKSGANAYGLMQVVPVTGRRWARLLGIRNFTVRKLLEPETNIRIGTAYLANLIKQLGSVPLALAGYNAGDSRPVRWSSERRGLPDDEFIDDIPFPETQNYIRRILGTAEDYRRLYAEGAPMMTPAPPTPPGPKPVIVRPVKKK
jgi:soluble lytic murein transglycosylase